MAEMQVKTPAGRKIVEETVKAQMRIMGKHGDTRVIWDPDNDDEVKQAEKTFNDLRKKRFLAFKVGSGGGKGEQIDKFDPSAEKLILTPPMAGG